jgi:hypothetical protein
MKGLFKKQGSSSSTNNPYPLARRTLVEVLHCIEQLMHLIDHLLLEGFEYEEPTVNCKAREGQRRWKLRVVFCCMPTVMTRRVF